MKALLAKLLALPFIGPLLTKGLQLLAPLLKKALVGVIGSLLGFLVMKYGVTVPGADEVARFADVVVGLVVGFIAHFLVLDRGSLDPVAKAVKAKDAEITTLKEALEELRK